MSDPVTVDPVVTSGLKGAPPITWPDGTVWPPPADGTVPAVRANLADFGPSVASVDVDEAVLGVLQEWLPTYLSFVKRSRSLGYDLATPKTYASVVDPDQLPDLPWPGIFVATAHTDGEPLISGEGDYETPWLVAISAITRGRTPAETRKAAAFYELAVRMAMVQQLKGTPIGRDFTPPIHSNAVAVRWISGGEVRPVADPNGRGRWIGEGASQFMVFTDSSVNESVGPAAPDQPAYESLAQVESIDIDVETVPINQDLGESE